MKILCTFFSDKFSILKKNWQDQSKNDDGGAFFGTDKVRKIGLGQVLLDLDSRGDYKKYYMNKIN